MSSSYFGQGFDFWGVLVIDHTRGILVVEKKVNGESQWEFPQGALVSGGEQFDYTAQAQAYDCLNKLTGLKLGQLAAITPLFEDTTNSTVWFALRVQGTPLYEPLFGARPVKQTYKSFAFAVKPSGTDVPPVATLQNDYVKGFSHTCYTNDEGVVFESTDLSNTAKSPWSPEMQKFLDQTLCHGVFPPIIGIWRANLGSQNIDLKLNIAPRAGERVADERYITYLLQKFATASPRAALLQDTRFYHDCSDVVKKWKMHGTYPGASQVAASIEKYRALCNRLAEKTKIYFPQGSYDDTIHVNRNEQSEAGHWSSPDREAICCAVHPEGFDLYRYNLPYTISPRCLAFPIFLFDKSGAPYNECEVVVFSVRVRKGAVPGTGADMGIIEPFYSVSADASLKRGFPAGDNVDDNTAQQFKQMRAGEAMKSAHEWDDLSPVSVLDWNGQPAWITEEGRTVPKISYATFLVLREKCTVLYPMGNKSAKEWDDESPMKIQAFGEQPKWESIEGRTIEKISYKMFVILREACSLAPPVGSVGNPIEIEGAM